ncbi:secretion-regulating guanine nucleotide exchange factor isoform X2 [Telopea speciosissima]|uniref:secretion-regulating guanine nucleotide exchange factor isoform X2 n=1 Tax=Telopea speciosissima TaxID=54955 RepID=UPI001CC65D64|nr:secretion-regulating guanine nucleotide exchange factor isoform X2 [Telopea speciosissima]
MLGTNYFGDLLLGMPLRQLLLKGRRFSIPKGVSRWFSSRAVMSWGDGSHGALGLPSSPLSSDAYEPTPVQGLPSDILSIGVGHYHSLAVTAQGEVWAWGRNLEAQLGRGLSDPRESWNEPKRVEGLDGVRVTAAFASGVISAAIGDDGSLWVWGRSKRGQLGLGKGVTDAVRPSRVEVLEGEEIVKVSLGWGHALALTKDGKLFGWGYSADGRLGQIGEAFEMKPEGLSPTTGHLMDSALEVAKKLVLDRIEKEKNMPIIWEPCLLPELNDVKISDVACGLDHSLILCSNGTLLSGGDNTYGQLGRVTEDLGLLPVDMNCFEPLSISSGLGHSLVVCKLLSSEVISEAKSIVSWGWNRNFQLGRTGTETIPGVVEGLSSETPVSLSGGRAHSIALTSKGELWVWGCGKNGRLGLGSSIDEVEPTLVECLQGFEVLQAVSGFDHNLVLVVE